MNLETRTAQVLAVTDEIREEYDESHPIMFAEQAPNRFSIMSWFFPDNDGVRVQEDLDLDTIEVTYFNNEGEIVLTEGALYDWALNLYKEDN